MTETIQTTTTESRPEATTYNLFIAGEWVPSESGHTFESRNPADTRDLIGHFQSGTPADVARAIRAADVAGGLWRRTPAPKRGEILYRFGQLMAEHKEPLARGLTPEKGQGPRGATRGPPRGGRLALRG